LTDTTRPARPTLEQLRAVAQPPEVRSRKNAEHWTAELYLRHISIYLTSVLVRTPISANGVTGLMILSGWAISACLLIPGIWGPLLAVFFSQLQLYFDCSDGEVARWRGTQSPKGIFLDKIGHYTTEGLIPIALGLRCLGGFGLLGRDPGQGYLYLFLGAVLALLIVLNKAQNEMVHASRAAAGMAKLPDTAEAKAVPGASLVGRMRRLARFLPFHRMLHSVEMSLLVLVAAIVSLILDEQVIGERLLLFFLVPVVFFVNIGHFVAIMASPRLRK
jgi:phosphatidylglycerophosphate synthase